MKTLFLVAGLVFVTCISLFSATEQEIITKLKEIDKAMMQGTINYKDTISNEKYINHTLVYNSKKGYKHFVDIRGKESINYFVGKHSFTVTNNALLITKPNIEDDFTNLKNLIFGKITANPSLRCGRGLTLLKDLKIDPAKNIATAYMFDGSMVKAYLDPNLDYAAYKSERGLGNSGFPTKAEMNNSNPILADGKYYIFSKSILYSVSFENSPEKEYTMELISATFKTPDEKDYIFDWNKNTFENIVDARGTKKQDVLVEYKKSELPEGITLDELLKITKRRAFMTKITNIYNKIIPDSIGLVRIIFAVIIIVALVIFFHKKRDAQL